MPDPTNVTPAATAAGQPMWQQHHSDEMRKAGEIITGKFADLLLNAVGLPPPAGETPELTIFDNACGSGVVTVHLLEGMNEEQRKRTKILCGDIQQSMLDYVTKKVKEEKWENVEVKFVDAQDTKLPSDHYTHVFSAFALMLVPKPLDMLKEIRRVLVPGGVNALTTWNRVGYLPLVKNAFAAVPNCPPFPDEEQLMNFMGTGRWLDPQFLHKQMEEQGFVDVKVEVKETMSRIESPAAFVSMFGDMFVGLATKWFTDEQKKEFAPKIKQTLLQQLQEEYGEGKPWDLSMTANIVTCRKPKN